MKTSKKADFDKLHLSDIYSLMLFVLFKIRDIPEYSVLSEMCYILDGNNMTRFLAYFAGKTIKIPTEKEFATLANALLLYQYINIDGDTLVIAQGKLGDLTKKQLEEITDLYIKLLPVMKEYNINRSQIDKNARH